MSLDPFSTRSFDSESRSAAIPIAEELALLRRRTLFATLLYGLVGCAAFTGLGVLLLWRFLSWLEELPAGAKPSWEKMVTDRPELLAISGVSIAVGIALGVGGMLMWRRIFGADRMPPRKLVLTIASVPLGLIVASIFMTANQDAIAAAITAPLMIGAAFALLPFQIGFLAYAMLKFSLQQVQERPISIDEEELPVKVAGYFQEVSEAAEECRLEWVGDFSYGSRSNKYRRYYVAPNGAYFVDSTYVSLGTVVLKATGVFSATDDGHYFETCDLAHAALGSDGSGPDHIRSIPGASLDELIEAHVQAVSDWTAQSGSRPLVFDVADVHALSTYGITIHMRDAKSDFMWLGNPYANQPVPPLPGRAWESRGEYELSGTSSR